MHVKGDFIHTKSFSSSFLYMSVTSLFSATHSDPLCALPLSLPSFPVFFLILLIFPGLLLLHFAMDRRNRRFHHSFAPMFCSSTNSVTDGQKHKGQQQPFTQTQSHNGERKMERERERERGRENQFTASIAQAVAFPIITGPTRKHDSADSVCRYYKDCHHTCIWRPE